MIVLITGAANGIGRSLALLYASRKCQLILIDVDKVALDKTTSECLQFGVSVHSIHSDVSNTEQMSDISIKILEYLGLPDIVIANAGIRIEDFIDSSYLNSAKRVMDVNYIGVLNTVVPFLPTAIKKNGGIFAIVSSIGGHRATFNSGIYSASKSAVNLWSEGLRLKLRVHNICISTIFCGFVDTAMTKDLKFRMPGIIHPDKAAFDIARGIERGRKRFYVSKLSGFLWRTFFLMPDAFYDSAMIIAKRLWPNRGD